MNIGQYVVSQFHQPRGILGHLAAWIMATRASNLERNRWTVDLLDVRASDKVLEIGPGPGVTLDLLCRRATNGHVVALDHSTLMLKECRRRNKQHIDAGRLALIEGSYVDLPDLPGPFDKIVAVNSLQFSGQSEQVLRLVIDQLKPGGTIAMTFQSRARDASDRNSIAVGERMMDLLQRAGAIELRMETLPAEPACAVCILGHAST